MKDVHSTGLIKIPDPLHQLIIGTKVKLMDLGSVVSAGILAREVIPSAAGPATSGCRLLEKKLN